MHNRYKVLNSVLSTGLKASKQTNKQQIQRNTQNKTDNNKTKNRAEMVIHGLARAVLNQGCHMGPAGLGQLPGNYWPASRARVCDRQKEAREESFPGSRGR